MKSCINCRWCSCHNYGKEMGTCMNYIEIPKSEELKEELEEIKNESN